MFTLDQVVPWGRSLEEYRRMFSLTETDLQRHILGCGDGPAGFNAEATRLGMRVVSADPLYRWQTGQIRDRIAQTRDEVLEQTRRNAGEFVWDDIPTVEALGQLRMTAMDHFLDDYDQGKAAGRYVDAALPALPFDDAAFDLALSSHFLFLYTTQLGETFHRAAVEELCRVAGEVRLFPLVALGGQRSPYVELLISERRLAGDDVSIEIVPYQFQRGANQMMRIRHTEARQG